MEISIIAYEKNFIIPCLYIFDCGGPYTLVYKFNNSPYG